MANLDFTAAQVNEMLKNEEEQDAKINELENRLGEGVITSTSYTSADLNVMQIYYATESSIQYTMNGGKSLQVKVKVGDKVKLTTTTKTNYVCPAYVVADSTNNGASVYQFYKGDTNEGVETKEFTITHDGVLIVNCGADKLGQFAMTISAASEQASIEQIREKTDAIVNILNGKRIKFFGDSVSAGTGFKSFAQQIGERNKMVCENHAKNGTTLAIRSGMTNSILETLKANSSNADYLIIQGGYNDYASVSEGAITPTTMESGFDTSTMIGAMEELCRYATTLNKKVGFILAYNIIWEPCITQNKLKEVCEKWGMPYLELQKCCGFNLHDIKAHRELYSAPSTSYEPYNASKTYALDDRVWYDDKGWKCKVASSQGVAPAADSTNWTYVTNEGCDGTHLNQNGHDKVVAPIEAWIKTL